MVGTFCATCTVTGYPCFLNFSDNLGISENIGLPKRMIITQLFFSFSEAFFATRRHELLTLFYTVTLGDTVKDQISQTMIFLKLQFKGELDLALFL